MPGIFKCVEGHDVVVPDDRHYTEYPCPECGAKVERADYILPGARGMKKRNTEVNRKCHFDHGDLAQDLRVQAKTLENLGKFKGPKGERLQAKMQRAIAHADKTPVAQRTRDYQKEGHQLDH
jgi:hypothetical protein